MSDESKQHPSSGLMILMEVIAEADPPIVWVTDREPDPATRRLMETLRVEVRVQP